MSEKDAKVYFSEKNGPRKMVELLKVEHKPLDLIMFFIKNSFVYTEMYVKEGGVEAMVAEIYKAYEIGKDKSSVYDDVE